MYPNFNDIIPNLSLNQKSSLLSGKDVFNTKMIGDVPSIRVSDGISGVSIKSKHFNTTCFPSAATIASTWDVKLVEVLGDAIAKECHKVGVNCLLAPNLNVKRSPLCGRNFEYLSEDPYLTGMMSLNFVKGVKLQNMSACIKHFAVYNQETTRATINVTVSERALREIYLSAFEMTVKEAKPDCVMSAYNSINGVPCSQNTHLLKDILRDEWAFDGIVMSDWGSISNRPQSLEAGVDLEMPGGFSAGDQSIVDAIDDCILSPEYVDISAVRNAKFTYKAKSRANSEIEIDKEKHIFLARKIATEGMVLLKNENNLLPLIPLNQIAVIGPFAKTPYFQGCGSSHIPNAISDKPFEELNAYDKNIVYSEGYKTSDVMDELLLEKALLVAKMAEVAIIFASLPIGAETEGIDRTHMRLPENQLKLIDEIATVQNNVVIILMNGAPVEMPFVDKVSAILETYLGGQAVGGAIADVIFGIKEPGGRLAETFPVSLCDTPCNLNFPGGTQEVNYSEDVFIGYRYYNSANVKTLFPFGHGLGYTKFEYSNMQIIDNIVSFDVKNIGSRVGFCVPQLYISPTFVSKVVRPVQELKGFTKHYLKSNEVKTVEIKLDNRSFSYFYNDAWVFQNGEYKIKIGESSENIVLSMLYSPKVNHRQYTQQDTLRDFLNCSSTKHIIANIIDTKSRYDYYDLLDCPLSKLPEIDEKYNQEFVESIVEMAEEFR